MINDHFNNDLSFSELSKKYQISYSVARKSCLKLKENDYDLKKISCESLILVIFLTITKIFVT